MLLNGKEKSKDLLFNLKQIIDNLKNQHKQIPKLVIITVGSDSASEIYVKNKINTALNVGMLVEQIKLNENISELELLAKIREQNEDNTTTGIIVQLPLPKNIDESIISNAIDSDKDVDCFTKKNIGNLFYSNTLLWAPTVSGIVYLLSKYSISLIGKQAVIIGRSNIVGKPLALRLLHENCTVTICHSYTKDLKTICKNADILFVAIGKPEFITKDYLKKGCIVIDVGINRRENKIVGDVNFDDVKDWVDYITPVPGGVGPLTVTMLIYNTILLYLRQEGLQEKDIKEHLGKII